MSAGKKYLPASDIAEITGLSLRTGAGSPTRSSPPPSSAAPGSLRNPSLGAAIPLPATEEAEEDDDA